jgi:hypothetical protein
MILYHRRSDRKRKTYSNPVSPVPPEPPGPEPEPPLELAYGYWCSNFWMDGFWNENYWHFLEDM